MDVLVEKSQRPSMRRIICRPAVEPSVYTELERHRSKE